MKKENQKEKMKCEEAIAFANWLHVCKAKVVSNTGDKTWEMGKVRHTTDQLYQIFTCVPF